MKTATVADLRNHFRRVSSWIENGESVQILKRGKPFAQLSAISSQKKAAKKPDIMAQLHATWGNKPFSAKKVREMREDDRRGEEG